MGVCAGSFRAVVGWVVDGCGGLERWWRYGWAAEELAGAEADAEEAKHPWQVRPASYMFNKPFGVAFTVVSSPRPVQATSEFQKITVLRRGEGSLDKV